MVKVEEILSLDKIDIMLLEEIIKFIPQYSNKYPHMTEAQKRKVLEQVVFGSLKPKWTYLLVEQDKNSVEAERTVGGFVLTVKNILISLHNFLLKGAGVDAQKAQEKTEELLKEVVKQVNAETATRNNSFLKNFETKKELLIRQFHVVYNSLLQNLEKIKDDEKFKTKNRIVRWFYGYVHAILKGYGYEAVTDDHGKTQLKYSTFMKRITGVGIFIGTLIGVGLILLFLMTKIPVVGRLFSFFLKILSAPLRVLWNGLGFILRKLRII